VKTLHDSAKQNWPTGRIDVADKIFWSGQKSSLWCSGKTVNQIHPIQQSRQHEPRAYCPNNILCYHIVMLLSIRLKKCSNQTKAARDYQVSAVKTCINILM